jgi:hypothetical protein
MPGQPAKVLWGGPARSWKDSMARIPTWSRPVRPSPLPLERVRAWHELCASGFDHDRARCSCWSTSQADPEHTHRADCKRSPHRWNPSRSPTSADRGHPSRRSVCGCAICDGPRPPIAFVREGRRRTRRRADHALQRTVRILGVRRAAIFGDSCSRRGHHPENPALAVVRVCRRLPSGVAVRG